jgi:ribosomal protein S18 acetylase RimI-like enzyme
MKLTQEDIYFEDMSEENAVKVFQDDGYFKYKIRVNRYENLPKDGIFANSPETQFVAFLRKTEQPIGVVGFSKFQNFLLGSGIHIREGYRTKDGHPEVFDLLLDKLLQEKGSKTMVVAFSNPRAKSQYEKYGFNEINEEELPKEVLDEINEARAKGSTALQKLKLNNWWMTIKRNNNFLIYRRD